MTLGQLRNAIDAMCQRGEFNPNLPAHLFFPNCPPHEATDETQQEQPNEQS